MRMHFYVNVPYVNLLTETECYKDGESQLYAGDRTCTKTGKPCQKWAETIPHAHIYTSGGYFPDLTVNAASEYCRDPDGIRGEPWCFTKDPQVEWEFCDVPRCSCKLIQAI